MERLRLGVVGLGHRGINMISTFLNVPNCDVVAVCDKYEERLEQAAKVVKDTRNFDVKTYDDLENMFKDGGVDAIYVASSWEAHINQAIRCMEVGIPVGMEVGGAYSIKDCWRLVDAYEKTKTPIMMMENCCYDHFEILTTKMVRDGKFGEIITCHGAYSHDLRNEITGGNVRKHYRLRNYINRNCENYPTHELGPIAKILNINRGNRMVSLVSVASKSRGLELYTEDERCPDSTLKGQKFKQADIVNTIIKCENGETITMTLDTTLPGYYSRQFTVKGTKGVANQEANMMLFDGDHDEFYEPHKTVGKYLNNAEQYKDYLPEYWQNVTEEQIKLGHGGMDFIMCAEFVKCVMNKLPMPIDVYDAAAWYSITPLTAESIKRNGKPYKIPDFTRGKYKTRKPEDVL